MPGFNLSSGGEAEPSAKAELRRKHRWLFRAGFMEPGEYAFLKSASRPSIKIEETSMAHDQETAYFAGRHTWETVQLEFYDAENPKDISAKIYKWLVDSSGDDAIFTSLGLGGSPQVAVREPGQYKIEVEMQMIDGQGLATETWKLLNAWPKEVNWGALDYSTSDIATVQVMLRFDRAIRENGGESLF